MGESRDARDGWIIAGCARARGDEPGADADDGERGAGTGDRGGRGSAGGDGERGGRIDARGAGALRGREHRSGCESVVDRGGGAATLSIAQQVCEN